MAAAHHHVSSHHHSNATRSFLNGLRKAHLLRRKTLETKNSRITQPLMEGTQTTSITMQPTEINPNDYCLMKTTTDADEDRGELQHIVDISTTTTTSNTNPTIFYNTRTTTAPTSETMMLQQTTTALVTQTTLSSNNSSEIPATAVQLNSTITNLTYPLVTLPIIVESSTGISVSKNTTVNHHITTLQPETETKATTKTASFTASDCLFDLATSNSTRNANLLSFSSHDLEQINEAL